MIKILTTPLLNKESRIKLKQKADKEILASNQDDNSDAETIPYAEPYRDTSKKDEIYRRKAKKKAIRILNKRRKLNPVAKSNNEQDNFSDTETIPYAEPYRDTFTKKRKYIGKRQRKKP